MNTSKKKVFWQNQWLSKTMENEFNFDPCKRCQEVMFSRKYKKTNHDSNYFTQNSVQIVTSQKYFGMCLDTKLLFQEYLKKIMSKVHKTMC